MGSVYDISNKTPRTFHYTKNVLMKESLHQKTPNEVEMNNRWEIIWRNVILFVILHIGAVYGSYLFVFVCTWKTFFWSFAFYLLGEHGVTAGAHRLWAHRCYKAKLPLRVFLMVCQSIAFQNDIYEWVRDHRVHHKHTDTNADPHNINRGFFFSHIGWLMLKKHKDVTIKGKTIDVSDLEADPVVMFQRRHYAALVLTLCFAIPAIVPWFCWGEGWWVSWYTATVFRYAYTLNCTWLVNSVAHIWGSRPYDKSISPVESPYVSLVTSGEGWHNYHHAFPWDYKAAELGNYKLNITTMMIDFFSLLGWAYDLKTVSEDMIKRRVKRTGDGTKTYDEVFNHHHENVVWGWGDVDMKPEEISSVHIINPSSVN